MKVKIILVVVVFLVLLLCMGNAINLTVQMGAFTNAISAQVPDGIIEIKSVYGKLNGNGNGTQFFGAALVKRDSVQDLDTLVAALEEKYEVVEVLEQQDSKIASKHLEHRELTFSTPMTGKDGYIAICFFNSGGPNSISLDLTGH